MIPGPLAAPDFLGCACTVVDVQKSTETIYQGQGPAEVALEDPRALSFPVAKLALPDLDAWMRALLTWATLRRCLGRKEALSLKGWGTRMSDQVVASGVACSLWNSAEMVVISRCCCRCLWLGQWRDATCSLREKSGMMAVCHLVSTP